MHVIHTRSNERWTTRQSKILHLPDVCACASLVEPPSHKCKLLCKWMYKNEPSRTDGYMLAGVFEDTDSCNRIAGNIRPAGHGRSSENRTIPVSSRSIGAPLIINSLTLKNITRVSVSIMQFLNNKLVINSKISTHTHNENVQKRVKS